ncbi:MAG TPA: HlyD family secretion protein [Chlamydiales bacterium]|nr:HlyD family secretion protein [Chlamydiales bacterium]
MYWNRVLLIVGLILVILLIALWMRHDRGYAWTNDAYLDGYQISISADINARITQLFVDEGDLVKNGQLLCQLDESIYQSQRAEAVSAIHLLEQQIALKEVAMKKMEDVYKVAQDEYQNQIISFIDYDKIEKDYQIAQAEYKVAQANQANGVAKLGVIEENLRHTKIYAPRDGAIAKRWVVAGDAVQFGQPLFSLTDTKDIWVTANFEETKLQHVNPGDPVRVHIDAYPGRAFDGTVFTVLASAASQFALIPPNNATGNFTKVVQRVPVKILLTVPNSKKPMYLYPGMSAEVDIKLR